MDYTIFIYIFIAIEFIVFTLGLVVNMKYKRLGKSLNNLKNYLYDYLKKNESISVSGYLKTKKNKAGENKIYNYFIKKDELGLAIDYNEINEIIKGKENTSNFHINLFINILPVIGLIGTFLGISLSIYNTGLSFEYDTLESFLTSIRLVFFSSLFGLFFSAILRIINGISYKLYNIRKNNFNSFLLSDFSFYLIPEKKEERLLFVFNKISDKMNRFTNNFIEKLDLHTNRMLEQFNNQISDYKKSFENIKDTSDNMINQLKYSSESSMEIGNSLTKASNNLTNRMNELKEIIKYQSEENKKSSQILEQNKELTVKFVNLQESLYNELENIFNKWGRFNQQLENVNNLLENNQGDFKKTSIAINQTVNELSDNFALSFKHMEENNENINKFLAIMSDDVSYIKDSKKSSFNLLEGLNKIYSQLELTTKNLEKHSEGLNVAAELLITNINNQLSITFKDIENYDNLILHLPNLDTSLFERINDSLDKMDQSLAYINKAMNNDNIKKKYSYVHKLLKYIKK